VRPIIASEQPDAEFNLICNDRRAPLPQGFEE